MLPGRSPVLEPAPDARLAQADRLLLRRLPLLLRHPHQARPRPLLTPRHHLPRAAAGEAGSLLPRQ